MPRKPKPDDLCRFYAPSDLGFASTTLKVAFTDNPVTHTMDDAKWEVMGSQEVRLVLLDVP